jgi:hypothetical protein
MFRRTLSLSVLGYSRAICERGHMRCTSKDLDAEVMSAMSFGEVPSEFHTYIAAVSSQEASDAHT